MVTPRDRGGDADRPHLASALAAARSSYGRSLAGRSAAAAVLIIAALSGCARNRTDAPTATAVDPALSVNARFDAWFTAPGNYDRVAQAVMHSGFTSSRNACVAFDVTAWRLSGLLDVPRSTATLQLIRIQTVPFSAWLMQDQGWMCSTDVAALQPGDVVFAAPNPGGGRPIRPEAPPETSHVYLFHGWLDRARGVAQVVDNQAPGIHRRNVRALADPMDEWEAKDPLLFFLRHP
jgi:hypothetical protein